VEFRLLGPLEVRDDGRALELGGQKRRALLALLLLHANEVVSTDRLIEELWGEDPPQAAATALHGHVSRLRKLLGSGDEASGHKLLTRPPGYVLQLEAEQLDLHRFERLRDEARAVRSSGDLTEASRKLRDALALWRGRPLADLAYERFAQLEAGRFEELRLATMEERIEIDLALGRHADLASELERLVAEHPLREGFRAQLMLALYRSGRQAEALQVYQHARRALVEELGIEPSRRLRELEQAMLRQDAELEGPELRRSRVRGQPVPRLEPEPPREQAPPREVRKTVTILFCDIVDSKGQGESTDPEVVRSRLARYFERMKTIVERHGGTLEKFIGDAVMAVFGVPRAHEDDALRACRAAIEMRDALPRLGIEGRIGLMTGEVVTGTEERLVTGDAVNVAARLERAAGAGEVLIGRPTFELAREALEVEALEPLELKGKTRPVGAYRLKAVHEPVPRLAERPFVGREQELATIKSTWERALVEQRCELFTIVGEAGVGKSRLVAEALASIDGQVVQGRCVPYGEGITYWPVVEVIKQLKALPSDPVAASAIRSLLGESQTGTSAEEIAWAFRKLLEESGPLVCVFDDIQWAEETFLDLLEHVALLSSGSPLLLLCMARLELLERRPSWPLRVRLEPLPQDEIEALIGEKISPSLRAQIVQRAGGNPLFVGEMLAIANEARGEIEVPPTLRAVLSARLDQLAPAERRVLESGSIEGEVFHRGAVQAIADEEVQVTPLLAALVRNGLVRTERAQFPGEDGFRFRHLLIRDAVYHGLPKSTRAELHERLASWLEERRVDLVGLEEILGYHLEQAYNYELELGRIHEQTLAHGRRAAMWLASAGRRARSRRDWLAAMPLLSRAVSLLPEGDVDRLQLLPDLGESIGQCGDYQGAIAVLEEAIERAEAAGDRRTRSYAVLFNMANRARVDPGFTAEEALSEAQEALRIFEELGDAGGQAFAWGDCAKCHAGLGHFAEARKAIDQALAHAIAAGDERMEIEGEGFIAFCLFQGAASLDEFLSYTEKLEVPAVEGRRVLRGVTFFRTLGQAHAMRGEFETARTLMAEKVAAHEELAQTLWARVSAAFGFGEIELLAGDPAAAERHLRQGFSASEEAGETSTLSALSAHLGEAIDAQGRHTESERYTRISEEAAARDDYYSQIQWRSVRAKAFAAQGRMVEAKRLAGDAVTLAEDTDHINLHGDALIALAEVLLLAERPDEAIPAVQEALSLYEQKGSLVSAGKARALLSDIRMRSES
jgi:DNA-binding SARP family transcriptional activator/predicted ATPase